MKIIKGQCHICGSNVGFLIADNATLSRSAQCSSCKASIRSSDIAKCISQIYADGKLLQNAKKMRDLHILNCCPQGSLHGILSSLPYYQSSEFFPDVPSGEKSPEGMLCVDLHNILFDDNYFDLIITEEVLEHVADPSKVFSEISRVLKAGGYHVFTVPVKEAGETRNRNGLRPVYHPAPFNKEGSLVYNEWGFDICNVADEHNMKTSYKITHSFYNSAEVTDLERDYDEYLQTDPSYFYKYNVICFVSKKNGGDATILQRTGERYIPDAGFSVENIMEHMQRYLFVQENLKNKVVLDAASGEGYGCDLIAQAADKVIGLEIAPDAVEHARAKYKRDNLSFVQGSVESLPFDDASFDAVVSFETLEHVSEEIQQSFIMEVKRVLRHDGIFVISTPDKKEYSDRHNYKNEFHIHELYLEDFITLLKGQFEYVKIYSQYCEEVCLLHEHKARAFSAKVIGLGEHLYDESFFIAVVSNVELLSWSSSILLPSNPVHNPEKEHMWHLNSTVAQLKAKNEALNEYNEALKANNDPLRKSNQYLKEKSEAVQASNDALQASNDALSASLNGLVNSTAWKITKPLRVAFKLFRKILKTQDARRRKI